MVIIRKCRRCGELFDVESPSSSLYCEDCLFAMAQEELEKEKSSVKYVPVITTGEKPVTLPKAIDDADMGGIRLTSKESRDALAAKLGRQIKNESPSNSRGLKSDENPKPVFEATTEDEWADLAEFAKQYKENK
jgi:hypothetical protein